MRVRGIIDRQGRVRIPSMPKLRSGCTSVWVEIPEQALLAASETRAPTCTADETALSGEARQMLEELDEIRTRPLADQGQALGCEPREDRAEAFALREDLRSQQGRP